MTIRNIPLYVRNVDEVAFTGKDGKTITFYEGYFGYDEFDSFIKCVCNKKVSDGVYNCACKVEFDFNKKSTKVKVFIGTNV